MKRNSIWFCNNNNDNNKQSGQHDSLGRNFGGCWSNWQKEELEPVPHEALVVDVGGGKETAAHHPTAERGVQLL